MSFGVFAMLNEGLKIYSQSPMPHAEFYRINKTLAETVAQPVACIGFADKINFQYSSKNLLSYSFSRNVNSLYGEFEIQVREDYTEPKCVLDMVKPLDIVQIYENKNEIAFMGIVQNVSFGATAGAFNKSVVISGASIGILFEMFNFSTDVTSMSFFIKDSANKDLIENLSSVVQSNIKNGGKGMSFTQAFEQVYKKFVEIATDDKYSRIGANGIYDIIKFYFGEPSQFIRANELNFNYQIEKNLFDSDEVNVYSYFKGLLPEQVYEFYETIDKNNPVISAREKPFDSGVWDSLKMTKLDPALVTDYTITKSNKEVYTCFFAVLEGTSLSSDFYKIIGASERGNSCFESYLEKIKKYGYRPLTVNFIGYAKEAGKNDGETSYLQTTFKELSKRLKEWYSRLDEMYTGDVTIVLDENTAAVKIGELVELCGCTFYVTGEKHNWSYGDSPTVNYSLERGGKYTADGFSPMTNISKAFSELLEKE